jgi:hypothetical protein
MYYICDTIIPQFKYRPQPALLAAAHIITERPSEGP